MQKIKIMITGFLMACADSVPGVSGGTICYIMGFYEKLFSSILGLKDFRDKEKMKPHLAFLLNLFIGWIIGGLIAVTIISKIVETNIYVLSSLFIGFILVSIPVTILQEKGVFKENLKDFGWAFLGLVIVVGVSYFGANSSFSVSTSPDFLEYLYIFLCGFIAIGCMLLPGISGSTMLIIFGLYYFIIDSISAFFHFDFSVFPILFVFGLGVLSGGFFAIKVIDHLLKKYRSKVLFFIQGLMVGSIYAIILGPTSVEIDGVALEALSLSTFSIIFCIIGGLLIFLLNKFSKK